MPSFFCFKYSGSSNRLRITMRLYNDPQEFWLLQTSFHAKLSTSRLFEHAIPSASNAVFLVFTRWLLILQCQLKYHFLRDTSLTTVWKEIPLLFFITILCSFPSQHNKLYSCIPLSTWILPVNSTMAGNMSFIYLHSDQ